MKNTRTELSQRVQYALLAGMAGAFLIPQVGFAAPTGGHSVTANINEAENGIGNTEITSKKTNNVITWRDYSVASGEHVRYDGGDKTNNYLNIVTGANTSNIDGKIEGGNHVYIVNPNGVIFGKSAVVNVGHLHVSTQELSATDAAVTAFSNSGASPLSSTAALKSDVVNMGTIKADTVEVHGAHIRFLNAKNVQTSAGGSSPVVNMYTAAAATSATDPDGGYAHIGYRGTAVPTNYTVHTAGVSAEYYQLVKDKTELATINSSAASLAGKYMLENDIDLDGAAHTPLGGNDHGAFTGKFDGNFFRVHNFKVSGKNSAGLFGEVAGGRIENLGVSQATIIGKRDNSHCYAGGIAGHTTGTSILKNVYVTETTKVEGRKGRYGGIVGSTGSTSSTGSDHTIIDSAYSKAIVGLDQDGDTSGGGIAGHTGKQTDITNTYSVATNSKDRKGAYFVYIITPDDNTKITNSYAVTGEFSSTLTGLEAGKAVNTYRIDENGNATPVGLTGTAGNANISDRYAGWDINNDGAPGAKWRIYEGRTLPFLTAFMNGRVDSVGSVGVEYKYRKFNKDGTLVRDFAQASNNHADVTKNPHDATKDLTYDSKIIKIVADGSTNIGDTSNVTYDKTLTSDDKNRVKTYTDTNPAALDRDSNIRNAGTKAILWSDQDGPNLRNVNVTINKRKVSVEGSNIVATRRYDGTRDVTAAFKHAITNGGIKAGGFTPEDQADGSVTITTSSDFKAEMTDKHVGEGKDVTFKGSLTFGGTNQSNYDIGDFNFGTGKLVHGGATITKAPLILKVAKDSATKIYDGTDAVTDAAMKSNTNVLLDETLCRTGETTAANIKTDGDTQKKDDVGMENIPDPTYVNSATGNAEVHANVVGTAIRYTNVKLKGNDAKNYELYYQMPDADATQTEVKNDRIDLKGEITRRQIKTDDFKVYEKGTNAPVEATKTYDGTNEYKPTNIYLSTDKDGDTGIVDRDKTHITFALEGGKGHFLKDTNKNNTTKNVKEATHVSYTVKGDADDDTDIYGGHLLSDYYVLGADGVTKNDPGAGFDAIGKGRITPKQLTATVVKNHIEKTYDGWADQTDGNRNKTVGDPLVTLTGYVDSESPRTNTSTATYASPNVAWDDATKTEKEQNVTYNVSFDRGTGAESDNYILDGTKTGDDRYKLTLTQDGSGNNYTGTIKRRAVALTMGAVDKIYDGTAANKKSGITGVVGAKASDTVATTILNEDGVTADKLKQKHEQMMTAGTAKSSYGRGMGVDFTEDANASNGNQHDVRYQNIDALFQTAVDPAKKNNYKVDDTVYGKGTINRRLIEKSGFQVRDKDGNIADATKVYDGTSVFALKNGETLVAKTAATGSDTGVVDKDKDNIYFTMTGENGHFTSDVAGVNRTSHKSEAAHVAYNVIAGTKNRTTSPLSNYSFGTSDTSKRDLENVNAANPDAVTAKGSITPAKIQAQTKEITKVYDGMAEHTDGNRKVLNGDKIVGLNLIADATGQPMNTSTAAYADKNVARDGSGNIIKKAVNYTAQLTGKYADDYQIVDAGNNVISNVSGTGDSKTVTATRNNVADMGTITPRKLNIKMDDVTKIYDGKSTNTSSTVTEITDVPQTSVIGTILDGDSITTGALKTAWENKSSGGTASSSYGNGTGSAFRHNANASNGTPHDVRYTKMDEAFKDAFGAAADNYTVDEDVYGKGTISRKAIGPNNFDIVDAHGHASHATKVYDGTSDYTVPSGWKLQPSTGSGTGVVDDDTDKIKFAIDPNKGAHFTKVDNTTKTANAYEAKRVAYNVKATADNGYEYLLKNYTLNGQKLESGNATATGAGEIKRRTINVGLAAPNDIDKVYDGNANLIDTATRHHQVFSDDDGRANVGYATGTTNANKLVRTKNGYTVDDGAQVTVEGSYADKNVARSGGNVTTKNITYHVEIAGNAGKNYYLSDGTTTVNAENGMNLSATGKITPKDLSGAFDEVTKTYDGTKYVDPSKVGFKTGADGVLSGDTVELATHTESFRSENVNGDGPTEIIDGAARKNWVNYENLSLGGADAGNYMLKGTTAKGLGTITPIELNDGSITFTKRQAEKVYDGTKDVKYGDLTGDALKKRHITSAKVTVGTAPPVDILDDLELKEAQYDKKDVDGGRKTDRVTYRLSYTDRSGKGNFSLKTGTNSFTTKGDGIITPKDVNVTVKSPLTKTYDAGKDVVGVAKNAAGNVVAGAGDNITLTGLVAGDGTKYETNATYVDKNAGDNKRIDYTLNFIANGGNYNLKYNGADNAGAFSTNNNTITKRNVDVTFDHVSKDYDSKETNTKIAPKVSDADAAVLRKDSAGNVSGTNITKLTGVTSVYGTLSGGTFTPDANAGDKTVRYHGVGTAMGTVFGTNNYDFNVKDGTGRINRAKINAGNVVFDADDAHKTYDGTTTVKYGGSSANSEVRKYINRIGVTLNGNWINLQNDVTMDSAEYSEANATNGTKHRVTYKFHLNNSNIDISGDNTFSKDKEGIIDRRVLNLDLAQKSGIDKIYDATDKVHNTDELHYDAFVDHDAKGNVTYAAGTTEDTKLVRKDGNPETTVKVTAKYADENAGAKNVNYTAQIEGNAGRNYTLKYGATEGNAETGINFAATGTIAKRKLTLGFDKASKQYDTEADNPDQKKLMSAIADNSDARGVDTLKKDRILAADGTVNTGAFDTTHVASEYGTRSDDPANPFTPDPNVGTKDVRYTNVKSVLSGTKAGNYEIVDTVYGTGEITRAKIKADDFDFQIDPSKKTYDGTTNVYWKDKEGRWQEAKGKDGLDGAKKYYFGDRSTVKLANGQRVKVNPADFSLTEAAYQNKNVAGGTETWTDADGNTHHNWVNYKLHINTTNFDVEGERDTTRKGVGTITKRDLATMLPKHLIKEYDGKQTFDETNRDYVNALANENITHIVKADEGKVQLKVKGEYDDPNASAETKVDAQKGIHLPAAPNGRKVKYTLTLSGDADTLANYTLAGHDTTHTVTGQPADIYKKTLTVEVGRKVKDYDGTAAVKGLTVGDITFQNLADGETLSLDAGALAKVKGQYLDSAGNPDANVSRDANRNVLDKAVEYTGLNDALNDLATRNNTAKNYRVEDGSKSYTADDGKGRIDPLKLHDPSNDVKTTFAATGPSKIYDRETTVKYKGLGTKEALKNYLTDATVMVGGKARSIKDELEIDPTRTHYDNKNAGTGKTVTYGFTYTGNNFEIADFTKESGVKGEIKRKDVKVLPVDQLWKTYDSERDVYVEGDDSIFTRRGGKQGKRVTKGDSVLELEPNGIISGDVVQNDSWAEFEDENAGTGKKVKYHTSFSGTDAANYRFVDVSGGEITKPLETDNNTIAKRKLNIGFDGLPNVTKAYDTDAKNDQITARITDDPNGYTRKVLARDKVHVFGDRLTQLNNTNIRSDYGEGKTDQTFRSDPNAGHKDVQYRGVGKALRNILGGSADNYETVPDNAYSDGAITKADVSRNEFDPNFTHAHKEYDGTSDVQNLDERYDKEHSFWNSHKLDPSNIESLTGSYRGTPSKRGKDVGTNKIVDYTLKLSNRNFNFVGWDGVIQKEGTGDITPREIFEDSRSPLTKVYDGTRNIANIGDDLLTFRHKSGERPFIKNDDVRNSSTATYDNKNVKWKKDAWKQGEGTVEDVGVTYRLKLTGRDAENYKIVSAPGRTVKDGVDQDGTRIQTTDGTGRITPKDIHLKADSQTRWINEGLPDSYSGTPMGSNLGRKDVPELVPGEVLPGQIEYSSPNARLRWGDYAINGTYRAPNAGTRYQLPDGTWTTQSFAGGDGDAVSRNYRFVQDPANATAFHMGPYVPDNQYYKALTQTSKMLPDEYAYEHAALDYRSHFGRDAETEIATAPPSINVIYDGTDVTRAGIHVTDDTVYTIVNEVFGA